MTRDNENIYYENTNQSFKESAKQDKLETLNDETSLKMVGWAITQRCNLSCPHCYTAAATSNQLTPELSTAQCYKIIEDISHLGAKIIGWTGGEPLLRNDLEDLISFAKSLGIRSSVTTNGLLLDEKRAESLKKSGLETVQVSLDGSTPERNAKIRKCSDSDFELVVNAVRNSHKLGMKTNLAMLLCAETLDDAIPYLDLAQQLEIEIVRFCGFVPVGRGKSSEITQRFLLSNTDLIKLREFVDTSMEYENLWVLFDPAFGSLPPDHCFHNCIAGKGQLYLDTLGNVYPCTSMINPQFLVGNIHTRSIEDIYKDARMRPTSNFSETCIKGQCASCEHLVDCHGGCRGITLAHTGDIQASFPYCLK